jgi:hypothetical protein
MAAGMEWIRANPARAMKLSAAKTWYFWFPRHADRRYKYPIWLFTIGGFMGLALMLRHDRKAALPLLSILLIYPAVYYLLYADFRYRYPIYQFSVLLTSYAVWRFAAHRQWRPGTRLPDEAF